MTNARLTTQEIEAIRNRLSKTAGEGFLPADGIFILDSDDTIIAECNNEQNTQFLGNAQRDITRLLAEVHRLRETLQFYANSENNEYELNNAPYWTEFKTSKVIDDGGWRASKALGGD